MNRLDGSVVIVSGADTPLGARLLPVLKDSGASVVPVAGELGMRAAELARERALALTGAIDVWIDCVRAPATSRSYSNSVEAARAGVDLALASVAVAAEAALPVWRIQGAGCLIAVADTTNEALASARLAYLRAALEELERSYLSSVPAFVAGLVLVEADAAGAGVLPVLDFIRRREQNLSVGVKEAERANLGWKTAPRIPLPISAESSGLRPGVDLSDNKW